MNDRRMKDFQLVAHKAAELVAALHHIGGTDPTRGEPLATRALSLAATKAEEALLWAQKHIGDSVYADELPGIIAASELRRGN